MTDDYFAFLERRRAHLSDSIRYGLIPLISWCVWMILIAAVFRLIALFRP
jgi:hypothetical protein